MISEIAVLVTLYAIPRSDNNENGCSMVAFDCLSSLPKAMADEVATFSPAGVVDVSRFEVWSDMVMKV